MRANLRQALERRLGQAEQLVPDRHETLAYNVEPAFGDDVMHVGDAAKDGILDRDHRIARLAFAYRGKCVLKACTGQRLLPRKRCARRNVRIGPGFALK